MDITPLFTEAWSIRHNVTVADALCVIGVRLVNAPRLVVDVITALSRRPRRQADHDLPCCSLPDPVGLLRVTSG
ncbi:MAG: hypothetical protein ACRDY3_07960 [Acidimicrobiales bacterium]